MVGYTHYHGMLPTHGTIRMPKQGHHASRSARAQAKPAQRQPPHVDRLETVHVLAGVDAIDQRILVDVTGQRRLHQDAVHVRVGIETVDQGEQVGLGGVGGKVMIERAKTDLVAGLALVAHVHRRGGIAADQHHGQPGRGQPLRHPRSDPQTQLLQQFLGDAFTVEYACAHADAWQ